MKQDVVKENVIGVFEKMQKHVYKTKKAYLMPPSRHHYFHPILILPVKMVEVPQQHENTNRL